MAQIGRRLAFGEQNVLAVKIRKGKPVARQIRRRHHAVGRKLGAERREIEAGIATIGHGHPQHQRMRLLLRPMRHVAGADVAREYFLSRDLRRTIDAIFQDAIVPRRPRQQLFFEQRRKGPASERSEIDGDAADQARAHHLPARRVQKAHANGSSAGAQPTLRHGFASRRDAAAPTINFDLMRGSAAPVPAASCSASQRAGNIAIASTSRSAPSRASLGTSRVVLAGGAATFTNLSRTSR